MTNDEMKNLQPGDIVRHKSGASGYVVTANYRSRVTAVCTVDITNPIEWVLVQKAAQAQHGTTGTSSETPNDPSETTPRDHHK